ncbi:hypothetical protein [Desulfoferrobacter suflitae]|uniref:hypothetical protein n=1 Tax=Desulfoferrobacter suflitae TaxID=2865782 RepID=UPI0021649FC1|nr:hypothetical protein [Desulfoferrobacter suflitae]MCK8603396.1 hypothetical protein [Desulfoferrobacter suflitae]
MKSTIVTTCFILIVLASAGTAMSDQSQQERFYNTCIDQQIAQCESISNFSASRSTALCDYADLNRSKARFLENNREELVQQLIEEDIAMKGHRVDYFLNKAFAGQFSKGLASSR